MVLSNAERQARYRQRLKEAAERGVTPEMVVKAAKLLHEDAAKDDPSLPPWEEYSRLKGVRKHWTMNLPDDPETDFSDFGEDAELLRKVAAVVRAVKLPPEA